MTKTISGLVPPPVEWKRPETRSNVVILDVPTARIPRPNGIAALSVELARAVYRVARHEGWTCELSVRVRLHDGVAVRLCATRVVLGDGRVVHMSPADEPDANCKWPILCSISSAEESVFRPFAACGDTLLAGVGPLEDYDVADFLARLSALT